MRRDALDRPRLQRLQSGSHVASEHLKLFVQPAQHLRGVTVGFVHLFVRQFVGLGEPRPRLRFGVGKHVLAASLRFTNYKAGALLRGSHDRVVFEHLVDLVLSAAELELRFLLGTVEDLVAAPQYLCRFLDLSRKRGTHLIHEVQHTSAVEDDARAYRHPPAFCDGLLQAINQM